MSRIFLAAGRTQDGALLTHPARPKYGPWPDIWKCNHCLARNNEEWNAQNCMHNIQFYIMFRKAESPKFILWYLHATIRSRPIGGTVYTIPKCKLIAHTITWNYRYRHFHQTSSLNHNWHAQIQIHRLGWGVGYTSSSHWLMYWLRSSTVGILPV